MLYAGRKLTALEACSSGLVSHVFWPTSLMQEVTPRVQKIVEGSAKVLLNLLDFRIKRGHGNYFRGPVRNCHGYFMEMACYHKTFHSEQNS